MRTPYWAYVCVPNTPEPVGEENKEPRDLPVAEPGRSDAHGDQGAAHPDKSAGRLALLYAHNEEVSLTGESVQPRQHCRLLCRRRHGTCLPPVPGCQLSAHRASVLPAARFIAPAPLPCLG